MRSDVKPEKLIQSGIIMINPKMKNIFALKIEDLGCCTFIVIYRSEEEKMNSFVWNCVGNSSLHSYYNNYAWKTVNVNNRYEKLSYWKEKKFPIGNLYSRRKLTFQTDPDDTSTYQHF